MRLAHDKVTIRRGDRPEGADSWRLSLTTVERPISVTKYRHDLVWSRRGKEAEHVSGQG